ncbi:MAG TPA: ADOP family duplicated permease [Longimicrobiales bacterium]|nr:ADOP family duplicated permease [Longimicrobiales bacterium]
MSRRRRLFHLRESRPAPVDAVNWEIEHHIQERIDELIEEGMPGDEAEEHARRAFGDIARIRREMLELDERTERRRRMTRLLDDLAQDLRFGLRSIRLHAGLAVGVVLTLALGIGANAAMFSVVDALLLRPLPYAAPDELVALEFVTPPNDWGRPNIPYDAARAWQELEAQPALLHVRTTALHTGGFEPLTVAVQAVTPEFHQVLGVTPVLGRGLLPEDADPAAPPVLVLDHSFWQAQLGGMSDVLERTVTLNGVEHDVVGVMPAGFRFPTYATTAGWGALRTDGTAFGGQAARSFVEAVTRVPPPDVEASNARLRVAGENLLAEAGPAGAYLRLARVDARRRQVTEHNQAMLLLSGAVLLILLVAGVNMANLLLARGSTRSGELAIRMAVGADRGRIMRQIATEALLLALLGGVVAVLMALLVVRALQGIMPSSITFYAPYAIAVEHRTLIFTFGAALVTGLTFGLLPALGATDWARPAAGGGMSRQAGRGRGGRWVRNGLVVAEVAFSVMLLVTAALLINSFTRLMRNDPGMDLDRMAVLQFAVSPSAHPAGDGRAAYLRELEERVAAVPGVAAATLTGGLPPHTSISFGITFEVEGGEATPMDPGMLLPFTEAGPDFFRVTGARLLAGRPFTSADDRASGNVIIDEDLARFLWPEGPAAAIGQRFRLGAESDWLTVAGVMADLRLLGPDERRGEFAMLYPLGSYERVGGQIAMAIRTHGDPRHVLTGVRAAVREVDANQPIQDLVPATTYYAQAVDMPRFLAVLMGILAALALLLASVGVHGVLAFGVAQRRHELGVRMVMGARSSQLRRLVVGEGLTLAAVGAALGVGGALLAGRVVDGVLYGVAPRDVATFVAVVATVLIVSAAATLRPANRAARLDPGEVLRG